MSETSNLVEIFDMQLFYFSLVSSLLSRIICLHCSRGSFLSESQYVIRRSFRILPPLNLISICLLFLSMFCLNVLNKETLSSFSPCNIVELFHSRGLEKKDALIVFLYFSKKHENKYLRTCTPNDDSNQPTRSLTRLSVVHGKKLCTIGYPKCPM